MSCMSSKYGNISETEVQIDCNKSQRYYKKIHEDKHLKFSHLVSSDICVRPSYPPTLCLILARLFDI